MKKILWLVLVVAGFVGFSFGKFVSESWSDYMASYWDRNLY